MDRQIKLDVNNRIKEQKSVNGFNLQLALVRHGHFDASTSFSEVTALVANDRL